MRSTSSTHNIEGTADRINHNADGTVLLVGDVQITSLGYLLKSDRAELCYSKPSQIKCITANGNVSVTQQDRRATCDKAVWEYATGEIAMTGNPVLTRGVDRVTGTKITLHANDLRVVAERGNVNLKPEPTDQIEGKDRK